VFRRADPPGTYAPYAVEWTTLLAKVGNSRREQGEAVKGRRVEREGAPGTSEPGVGSRGTCLDGEGRLVQPGVSEAGVAEIRHGVACLGRSI
jgi:hypothetical protein